MTAQTTEGAADAPGPVELQWSHLRDLYFRPGRFFQAGLPLGERRWLLPALLMLGVTAAQGRMDTAIMRAELGAARPGWEDVAPLILDSWIGYWLVSVAAGIVSAAFLWYLGGWWYHIRVRWAGAPDREKRRARVIYVWAGVVAALPALVYVLVSTVVFPDYRAAWASEDIFAILLVIFPFWSAVVSYRAVRTEFPVKTWPARIWFLILPWLGYGLVFGGIIAAYASGP